MLTVDQYEYIRIAHRVYGKGIRHTSRHKGLTLQTQKQTQSMISKKKGLTRMLVNPLKRLSFIGAETQN